MRSDSSIMLNFTVKAAGEATVKLVKAQMDVRANTAKDAQTASVPAGQSDTVTILCGGFPVVLPKCATGDAYVTANGDYTFTADPGYNYDFSATMDNEKLTSSTTTTAATRSKMSPASWSSAPTAHPLSKHTR